MNKKREEGGLKQVLQEADELLDQLDAIESKPESAKAKELIEKPKQDLQRIQQQNSNNSKDEQTKSLIISGWIIAAFVILIGLAISSNNNNTEKTQTNEGLEQSKEAEFSQTQEQNEPNSKPTPTPNPRVSNQEQVYFTGIDLPVTNSLCNKKGNFCIYGLARLVQSESGSANYTFEDVANGESVSIRGEIGISNIDKESDGTRTFTFSFRDNQSETTPGWAAAGYFNIEKNAKQPGIMTRFKTTESFGPKTPVGLENTSFLFPRS
jgi:hypothetical protein